MIPPQGGDRRGPTVTGGGKEKPHWIYSAKHHADTNQSQRGY